MSRITLPRTAAGRDRLARRLQSLLDGLMARKNICHAVMAVETGDESFRWTGAAGEGDSAASPTRPDTPCFIASIDKLYNATLAMQLSERGGMELDAPIANYLPRALVERVHCLRGEDYSERITVRHLMSHTSGLPDWLEDFPPGGRSVIEQVLDDGDRAMGIEQVTAIVRDTLKPYFPPQDLSAGHVKVRYSDTNYVLLSAVIEAVAGQPLHALLLAELFRPLGMRHSFVAGCSEPLEPAIEPARLRYRGRPLDLPHLLRSIRGIYSSATDMVTFLRALFRGALFARGETLAVMQQRWNRFGIPLDRAALRAPGWPIEYGLGLMRFRLPRIFTPLHPVPAVIGHSGSTGSWLFYCPQRDVLLAGSVDEVTAGALPYRLVPKVLRAIESTCD